MNALIALLLVACRITTTTAFQFRSLGRHAAHRCLLSLSSSPSSSADSTTFTKSNYDEEDGNDNNVSTLKKVYLYNPSDRDKHYQGNIAQYLLDMHHEGATFDFCGGMIFQLVLTDKLIAHLEPIASNPQQRSQPQPIIHPASQSLMSRIPNYNKSSYADNNSIFHGREIRKVSNAKGGMGFVLQLSYADIHNNDDSTTTTTTKTVTGGRESTNDIMLPKGADVIWNGQPVDPQGWSTSEISTYDGWRSDTFRQWRNARMYESEADEGKRGGFTNFSKEMGKEAYGLHHRFFLHYDDRGRMWLCAEDGCEGTPVDLGGKRGLFGTLLDRGMMMFGK